MLLRQWRNLIRENQNSELQFPQTTTHVLQGKREKNGKVNPTEEENKRNFNTTPTTDATTPPTFQATPPIT
jgi:hypothetical protein